jgi:hypothetical protein
MRKESSLDKLFEGFGAWRSTFGEKQRLQTHYGWDLWDKWDLCGCRRFPGEA